MTILHSNRDRSQRLVGDKVCDKVCEGKQQILIVTVSFKMDQRPKGKAQEHFNALAARRAEMEDMQRRLAASRAASRVSRSRSRSPQRSSEAELILSQAGVTTRLGNKTFDEPCDQEFEHHREIEVT